MGVTVYPVTIERLEQVGLQAAETLVCMLLSAGFARQQSAVLAPGAADGLGPALLHCAC